MPIMFGNGNTDNFDNNTNTNTYNNNFFLKEEARKHWYVYRATPGGVVKPYPVFDSQGNPCPVLTGNFESQFSHLPDAFAVVPMASYSGMDGKLSFIDYCSDMQSYCPEGKDRIPTPYSYFISGLYTLLPEKDSNKTRSGLPTPTRLNMVKRSYISKSKLSIMFRGCMIKHKSGAASTSKYAVNGMLFNCIYLISPKSAVNSFTKQFLIKSDPELDLSLTNTIVKSIFNLSAVSFRFSKTGSSASDDYVISVESEPDYVKTAMQAFNIGDPSDYFKAIRMSYGAYPTIESLLHVMTTAEMIDLLKHNYPISWLWYGLKDSPYASFFTPDEKKAAYNDPEMAPWFGIAEPNNMQVTTNLNVNNQPNLNTQINLNTNPNVGYLTPNNPNKTGYANIAPQVATNAMSQAEVTYTPNTGTFKPGAQVEEEPQTSYTDFTNNRMSEFEKAYGGNASFTGTTKTDGIIY